MLFSSFRRGGWRLDRAPQFIQDSRGIGSPSALGNALASDGQPAEALGWTQARIVPGFRAASSDSW